jgi:hypothetical protein
VQKLQFEKRAVAFLDVLGFKSVVAGTSECKEKIGELEDLIHVLKSAVPNLDGTVDPTVPRELIPKHIYISDNIILSAPLTSEKMLSYRGLSILVMRVIQLSHILLSKGYLIRGGISIGDVWHTNSNIVGTAYQEAYQIETQTLVPRVELSDSARLRWDQTEGNSNKMCLEYRGHFMVNSVHDFYIQDKSHDAVKRAFQRYYQIVNDNIESTIVESVQYKWWWFKQYLDSEVKKNVFIINT